VIGASKMARNIGARKRLEMRERFVAELDDTARPLTDLEEITPPRPGRLANTWRDRCAYAAVEDDEGHLPGHREFNKGVGGVGGRYAFR
jgi:hypothetical protein